MKNVNWNKLKHVVLIAGGLLAAFAGVVYQGSLADNQVTPTMTFGVLAGLLLVGWSRLEVVLGRANDGDVSTIDRLFHGAVALAGMAMPILVLVKSRYAPGSQGFIVAGYVTTFLGDLTRADAVSKAPLPPESSASIKNITGGALAVLLAAGLLAQSSTALAAEPTPSDVAPPISFCIGQTFNCGLPDFNLNTVSYDLGLAQWKAGVTTVAVGYMFLYASDKPWASGAALHGAGQWSQGAPSYFALVPTLVFAKYFEVGMSFVFLNGRIEKDVTLGLSANAENLMTLVTGKTMSVRLQAARLAYAAERERQVAKVDEDERAAREIRQRRSAKMGTPPSVVN
jgi:hypothetical protein